MSVKCKAIPLSDITDKLTKKFWKQVNITSKVECWEWNGILHNAGYGYFCVRKHKLYLAHRYAYQLAKGIIHGGLLVRHSCDNRRCCNPSHLELGTNNDNMNDMVVRNRVAHGEDSYQAVLTEPDVLSIRNRVALGETIGAVARDYNIHKVHCSLIVRGKCWKRVGGPRTFRGKPKCLK